VKRFLATLAVLLLIPLPAAAEPEIVPGSSINLVARDARIPVTISNPDAEPVTVTLVAESTSFRLEVLETAEVLVPAGSTQLAEIPVRAIANGPVEIRVWLEIDGGQIGAESVIEVSVNYDVELFLLVSFAVAMFALMIVGVIRTTLRLRRRSE
jgi:hypothetical protein